MPASPAAPIAERLTAQLLAGPPARDPLAVAERLLATQAQDPRGARLAVRARSRGLTAAHVDRALSEQRSLVITWLNRGTLHLVRSEDYAWLHPLTAPQGLTGVMRRLSQEGVSASAAERGVDAVQRALEEEGPLVRAELQERVAASVRSAGQALYQLLFLASLRGLVLRGPMKGGEQAYVLVRDWLGEQAPPDRAASLAELARRYLAGHGPASDRDLARWAGVPLRDARAGLGAIAGELEQRPDGLVALARRRAAADPPAPRLLGAFEPLLLGWTSREPIVGTHERRIAVGGVFRPFALVGGRAVATWRIRGSSVEVEGFRRVSAADRAALEADGERVLRYLGRA